MEDTVLTYRIRLARLETAFSSWRTSMPMDENLRAKELDDWITYLGEARARVAMAEAGRPIPMVIDSKPKPRSPR